MVDEEEATIVEAAEAEEEVMTEKDYRCSHCGGTGRTWTRPEDTKVREARAVKLRLQGYTWTEMGKQLGNVSGKRAREIFENAEEKARRAERKRGDCEFCKRFRTRPRDGPRRSLW